MVSYCVNPACRREFRLLNTGDLYALERRSADTEFFWLCSACVPVVAVCLDTMGCISVRPRSETGRTQIPYPDYRLRLVYCPIERTPWLRAGLARGLMISREYRRDSLGSSSEAA
jgi:hypothetical protein